jgi:hypothetical protein
MRKRSVLAMSVLAAMVALLAAQSATAATVVGNGCQANTTASVQAIVLTLANGPGEAPAAVPSAGVITGWTLNGDALPAGVIFDAQLKVLRPSAAPKQFTVVGESAVVPTAAGLNTFQTRIPVHAGDLLGETGFATNGVASEPLVEFCAGSSPGDRLGAILGSGTAGQTVVIDEEGVGDAAPLTATVEPDADGDGFGDETQDKCPTDASTQAPCPAPPAPPAPITLSASAAAKKGLVTVSLTSTAQVTVTVGGSVKLGKGKGTALTGGSQIVAPGTLAKFTVVFPAKLKAKLRQLPPSRKVSLALTASAPGSTGTTLTVKVPGQKKATPRGHHRS